MPDHRELKGEAYIESMIEYAERLLNIRFWQTGQTSYSAYCPFHADTDNSFRVYVDDHKQVKFHCHGECGKNWDIYDLIDTRYRCGFKEAQLKWAGYLGIEDFIPSHGHSGHDVPPLKDEPEPDDTVGFVAPDHLPPEIVGALTEAVDFYHGLLLVEETRFPKIHNYLSQRGVGRDIIERFRIGWVPPYIDEQYKGRALIDGFLPRFNEDYQLFQPFYRAGIVRLLNDEGARGYGYFRQQILWEREDPFSRNYGDFFAGRMTFPLFDINEEVCGIVGRRPDNRGTRWLKQQGNDTHISTKSWLFGIDKAQRYIQHYQTVILVEGIFDYFAFYRLLQDQDKPVVVSTLGTHLSEEALNLLTSLGTKHFIVAFDWDDGGKRAIHKAAESINGAVYYLGGMAEGQDPYDKLKGLAGYISGFSLRHLLSGAEKAQEQTDKPVVVAFISSGAPGKRFVQFNAVTSEGMEWETTIAPATDPHRLKGDLTFEVDDFLPLLTYGHGNKVMLNRAVADIIERITAGQGPTTGKTFRLPANFVNDRIYEQMGPALILWLRIAIEQQRRKRRLRVRDTELGDWLGTSRATINVYKRTLNEQGFLNINTKTRPQVLSVSYFPRLPE
ncbi:MAG: toprim domain-containing protein [Desulfobacterales bacterium]|nr:toprim domain-containing protein [Desulfobacterales bacterium]